MEDVCSVEYDAPNSTCIALSFLFPTNDPQITCHDGEVPAKPASTMRRPLQELKSVYLLSACEYLYHLLQYLKPAHHVSVGHHSVLMTMFHVNTIAARQDSVI